MPDRIVIRSTLPTAPAEIPVFVYGEPGVLNAGLVTEVKFPWIGVVNIERLNRWTAKVNLVLDETTMPRDLKRGTTALTIRPKDKDIGEPVRIVLLK